MSKDYLDEIKEGEEKVIQRDKEAARKLAEESGETPVKKSGAAAISEEAEQVSAEAKLVKAQAEKTAAQGDLWKARSDNGVKLMKSVGKWAAWGAALTALFLLLKGGCEAVKEDSDNNKDGESGNRITRIGKKVTTATLDTAEAGADAATSVSEGAKEGAERFEDFTTRPSFLKFITDVEAGSRGKSWLPGARSLQANSWNSNNPKQPLSKEQLESILNTRKYYKDMHNGQPMPENEFYKLVDEVCPSWPKKGGKPIIHSRITGRN
ncbi:MAG: hypothetical protein IKQ99_02935 [Alphaproteobacteria bacterium]|nr:hypothetical protein [Alphaproteobacteria bacterium]